MLFLYSAIIILIIWLIIYLGDPIAEAAEKAVKDKEDAEQVAYRLWLASLTDAERAKAGFLKAREHQEDREADRKDPLHFWDADPADRKKVVTNPLRSLKSFPINREK